MIRAWWHRVVLRHNVYSDVPAQGEPGDVVHLHCFRHHPYLHWTVKL